jgi:hypothetical protein
MITDTGFSKEKCDRIRYAMSTVHNTRGFGHKKEQIKGYVYLAEGKKDGLIKIGCSTKPKQRFKQLRGEYCQHFRLLFMYFVPDMYDVEHQLHAWFCDERVGQKELFRLSRAQIAEAFALTP